MNRFSSERTVAVEAVWQAVQICQDLQTNLIGEETAIKQDRSPVTIADFSSQAIIIHTLRQAFPHDPVVAEENASDLLEQGGESLAKRVFECVRTSKPELLDDEILAILDSGKYPGGSPGRFWTLDPIDGTKGFLRGGQYAISLGLIENGEVVLGVLGCPNYPAGWRETVTERGFLFIAVKGQGTISRSLCNGHECRLQVASTSDPAEATFCESVEAAHSSHDYSGQITAHLGVRRPPLRMDSQCKYAAVARSDASIYLRLPTRADYREAIWDHAAGTLVTAEAGGAVTDIEGKPLDFSCGRTLANNRGIVASNGSIHNRLLESIRAILSPK